MPYNSLIRVNKKNLKCGHYDYDFSRGRCKQCAVVENFNKKTVELEDDGEDLRGLIEDADALVSRYVRLKALDKETGMIKCYTCQNKQSYGDTDAGHYIPRANMYLRFDYERNIRCQCHICNRTKYGMAAVFAQNLEKEIPGLPERLQEESRLVYKQSREELRALISDLTEKIAKLKSK